MNQSDIKNLNSEQKKAVEHITGPALIVAGAGTGKTTVLIERLNFLFQNKHAKPDEILLLTFTEKGAGEMEDRALKILPYGYTDLWISTFHSFCERILRQHALDIGLSPQFKLLTQTQQWILIKKNIERFDLDYYKPLGNPDKFIYELTKHFSRLKDENISAEEYLDYIESHFVEAPRNKDEKDEVKRLRELANAYHVYTQICLEEELLDFGDLIFYCIKLFKERSNILKFYQEKFKFVMVDEFQDTNLAQYVLIKILVKKRGNIIVVGDDDQAIYKFRGASISNIMQFKEDFPKSKEVVLNKNYRSGQNILDAAYKLIQNNNPNRLEEKLGIDKNLESQVRDRGQVEHIHLESQFDELSFVAEKIREIRMEDKTAEWQDFAILVRANSGAEAFTEELQRAQIPNTYVSLRGLFLKPIVLDIIAYFNLLDNYRESSALFRVMNMEAFKVDQTDQVKMNRFARQKGWSLFETLQKNAIVSTISEKSRNSINKLVTTIIKHVKMAQEYVPSKILLDFVNTAEIFKDKDYDKDQEFFSLVNQFYQKIKRFEEDVPDSRLKDFIELLNMEREAGDTGALRLEQDDADTVKVMTVHASKGLEFKYVFLVNLVDKKFPSINRKDKIQIPDEMVKEVLPEGKQVHLEEERRLFYVALTRAKNKSFLLSSKDYGGVREKKPSIFIEESGFATEGAVATFKKQNELLRDLGDEKKNNIVYKTQFHIPAKFSFSQLAAFANCPLQYKFNWILGVPVEQKAVFSFGRTMHATLRDFMAPLMLNEGGQSSMFEKKAEKFEIKNLKFSDLESAYENNWQKQGYKDKKQHDDYKKQGKKSLKLFFEYYKKEERPEIKFLEKTFLVKVSEYIFKGAIDRVDRLADGTHEIIDYKTGNPKTKLTFSDKKQLLLYLIALEEVMGFKVSSLAFFYLSDATKVSFEPKSRDVEKLKNELIKGVKEICKGDFTAKPSVLCGYCDFRGICEFRQK